MGPILRTRTPVHYVPLKKRKKRHPRRGQWASPRMGFNFLSAGRWFPLQKCDYNFQSDPRRSAARVALSSSPRRSRPLSLAHCLPIPPCLYLAAQPSARSSQAHFISASRTRCTCYGVITAASGLESKYRVLLRSDRSSRAHVVTTHTINFFPCTLCFFFSHDVFASPETMIATMHLEFRVPSASASFQSNSLK